MKTDHGLKMQVLKLSLLLLAFLSYYADAKTLKVDEITASVTNGDFTITPNGTGDIVLGSSSGFVKLTSGVLSTEALVDVAVDLSSNQSVAGEKTFTGKFEASSTSNGFKPCPVMTEAQRDAIGSPEEGDCVINSDTNNVNFYLNSEWSLVGAGYFVDNTNISSTTTLASSGQELITCSSFLGDVTLNLPTAVGNDGLTYRIRVSNGDNTCIVDPNGAELVGGETTINMETTGDYLEIRSNGTAWIILIDQIQVFARYTTDAGQTIASSTLATVVYEDIASSLGGDTHSAYNTTTGVYTVPLDGIYHIVGNVGSTLNVSAGDILGVYVAVEGTRYTSDVREYQTTSAAVTEGLQVSGTFYLSSGDEVEIKLNNLTSNTVGLSAAILYNNFSITRVYR